MELPNNTMDKKILLIVILIALVIIGIYMFMSTCTTLWDRDEPEYAQVVMEMVESGDYVVPTFNSQMWFEKPPLFYWMMSIPVRIFGPTEFACRFLSAIGVGTTCLLTFIIGRKLVGTEAGLWTMPILASTLLILVIGTVAITDALLLPFIVAVMVIFMITAKSGMSFIHIILMGVALGLGTLTKGPIGLMPMPAIAAILFFDRKNRNNTGQYIRRIAVSLAIGAVIFLIWAIPVNIITHGEFFRVFVGRDIINRALRPMESHGGNFVLFLPYYLIVIVVGFFPWTLHLPGAFSAVIGGRIGGKYGRVYLLSWIIPCVILMTLAATKLPHYIIFIWPALSLAVAGTISAAKKSQLIPRDIAWLRRGVWFFGPQALIMSLFLMIAPFFIPIPGLLWPGMASGLALLVMTITAVYYHRLGKFSMSAAVLLGGMIVFHVPLLFGVFPAIEYVKISPHIAREVKSTVEKDVPVATYQYSEPSLNFYLVKPTEHLDSPNDVIAWAKQSKPGVLIIPKQYLIEIERQHGTLPLDQIASRKGFNYSKGEILELLALTRRIQKQ
jgi:4-amino-4-deoxy-L-arabinose transferase-like glycosyltransferase